MSESPTATERDVVLLVDDNPSNLAVLFEYLEERGFRVLIAEDGPSAVDLARQVGPHVILLDVMMPGVDGFETCRRLKADQRTRDIPVIFMTALADTRDKLAGFDAGAVDYVTKPFRHEEVLARIRTHAAVHKLDLQLRNQNALLEQEVAQRKRAEEDLAANVRMLEAQNAELEAFARTVAHNLKAPLTGLLGFSDLLEEEGELTGDPARYLEAIQISARRMTDITEELLLLARLRAQDVERKPLDMAVIVENSRDRLAPLIEDCHADVIIAPEWPQALGHGPWVEEVWVNYLSNALKYGGQPPRIEVGATPCGDGHVRYWVRDNGPGIDADARPHLFTEFTRLNQINTQGYGLGLSIVKRIIDKLGGRVGVDSRAGAGSTFYFDLEAA